MTRIAIAVAITCEFGFFSAGSLVRAQTGPDAPAELPRQLRNAEDIKIEIKPEDVEAVIGLFQKLEQGKGRHVLEFVGRSGLSLNDFEVVLADVIYAVIERDIERAEAYFAENKVDEYKISDTDTVIEKKDLPRMKKAIEQYVGRAYRPRGGAEQFRKNQKVILKYERTIKQEVLPSLGHQRIDQPPDRTEIKEHRAQPTKREP